jgi:hypothetical protein
MRFNRFSFGSIEIDGVSLPLHKRIYPGECVVSLCPNCDFAIKAALPIRERSDYRSSSTPNRSPSPRTFTHCAFPIVPAPFGPIS